MPLRHGWTPNGHGPAGSNEPSPSQGQDDGNNYEQGDPNAGQMDTLKRENFQFREKNRRLTEQLDAMRPAYEQYQALGAPDEVAARLRQNEIERVAGKAGLNPQVFSDLDRMAGGKLKYEIKMVDVDGQQVEQIYVTDESASVPDAQGQPIAAQPQLLSEYAQAKWAAYLPALQPGAHGAPDGQQRNGFGAQANPQGGQPTAATPPAGIRFPAQHPGGGGGAALTPKTIAQNTLKKAYPALSTPQQGK